MKLQMVGCSHHNAPVGVRERLAFTPLLAAEALARWRERFPGSECAILSTCNRVEIYTAADDPAAVPTEQHVKQFLADFHGLALHEVFDDLFEQSGEGAVRHLFTVASSLDSMVLGEPQILSQVKQAYQLAQEHLTIGPITHDVFQRALHVAKRVASETSINENRVSIASIAVAGFARDVFETFDDKNVLLIGAGEMAEETLTYLHDEGARRITVVNRNREGAEKLASRYGGRVAVWEDLNPKLAEADMVVSTTGAAQPIVSLDRFRQVEPLRYQRPLFVLDLAVPRDFDPAIGDCLGVYLYSLDDLETACRRNRALRDQELPRAVRIIDEETEQFMQELYHRTSVPIIQQLREGWHAVCDQELQRLFKRMPNLDAQAREEIRQSFERYVNKLLHPPLQSLRHASRHGTPQGLLEALRRLFHLGE